MFWGLMMWGPNVCRVEFTMYELSPCINYCWSSLVCKDLNLAGPFENYQAVYLYHFYYIKKSGFGTEWNGTEWNRTEQNGSDWNKNKRNGMEWNGTE